MKLAKLLLLSLTAVSAILPARAFAADTTLGYTINALPYVATLPGVYHFVRNLTYAPATGNAITVNGGDISIDLNGFELIASAGATNTACGIYTAQGRVSVSHGTIRGFSHGVIIVSPGARISDLYFTSIFQAAIGYRGNNYEIVNNRICNTGGASGAATSGTVIAISVSGALGTISNNEIEDTFAPDLAGRGAVGIQLMNASNVSITNNRILDVEPSAPGTSATSVGIIATSSSNMVISGNTITTSAGGIDMTGASNAKYGDNTCVNVKNAYIGGSGANGNDDIMGNN